MDNDIVQVRMESSNTGPLALSLIDSQSQLAEKDGDLPLAVSESTAKFAAALAIQRKRQEMEQRRKARETHHHKDLWTKQPHSQNGGYYKVESSSQRIASRNQLAPYNTQQTLVRPEDMLGYEYVPHKGPTTNFVGDAMTMGAVDLIHEELKAMHTSASKPGNAGSIKLIGWEGKGSTGISDAPTPIATATSSVSQAPPPSWPPVFFASSPAFALAEEVSQPSLHAVPNSPGGIPFQRLWARLEQQGKIPHAAPRSQ